MARGRVQTLEVPNRLGRIGEIVAKKTSAVALREYAGKPYRRNRFDIEQIDNQQIARLRPFDMERTGQRVRTGKVNVAHVVGAVIVLDLRIEKIERLDDDFFTGFNRRQKRNIRVPAVMAEFGLLGKRYAWFDGEMLHLLSPWYHIAIALRLTVPTQAAG